MTKRKSKQIAELFAEREQVGAEIANLRELLLALERRGDALTARILHLQMSGRTRVGQPTFSNAIIRRLWEQVQKLSWDGRGIPADDLLQVLRSDIPNLRTGTLRVYLHRLKQRGLIEKRGSSWHRTSTKARCN